MTEQSGNEEQMRQYARAVFGGDDDEGTADDDPTTPAPKPGYVAREGHQAAPAADDDRAAVRALFDN